MTQRNKRKNATTKAAAQAASTAQATAVSVTKSADSAEKASEKASKAFERLMDALRLKVDIAAGTKGLRDDIKAQDAIIAALRDQIEREGRTTELVGQLVQARRDRADLVRQARDARQFTALGLTETGEPRGPSTGNLKKRLGSLRQQIEGTFLDTAKTNAQLNRIAAVLKGKFGKVGKDVRAAILAMMNDISSALKSGVGTAAQASGEITRGGIKSLKALTDGLGLTPEQIKEMGRRQMGVARRDRTSAFGFGVARPSLGLGFGGALGDIVVHTHVELDGREIASSVNRTNQKNGRRRAGARSGRTGGRPVSSQ